MTRDRKDPDKRIIVYFTKEVDYNDMKLFCGTFSMLFFYYNPTGSPTAIITAGTLLDSAGIPIEGTQNLTFLYMRVPSPTHLFGRKLLPYSLAMVFMLRC